MATGFGDLPVTVAAGAAGQVVQPLGWTLGGAAVLLGAAPVPAWGAGPLVIDATGAQILMLIATSNVAFTVGAPTGLVPGLYVYVLRNASGGVLGAATYNAIWHFAGAFTNPANLNQRSALLRYDGTALYEVARTPADVLS